MDGCRENDLPTTQKARLSRDMEDIRVENALAGLMIAIYSGENPFKRNSLPAHAPLNVYT
jgi:hypothetical protein